MFYQLMVHVTSNRFGLIEKSFGVMNSKTKAIFASLVDDPEFRALTGDRPMDGVKLLSRKFSAFDEGSKIVEAEVKPESKKLKKVDAEADEIAKISRELDALDVSYDFCRVFPFFIHDFQGNDEIRTIRIQLNELDVKKCKLEEMESMLVRIVNARRGAKMILLYSFFLEGILKFFSMKSYSRCYCFRPPSSSLGWVVTRCKRASSICSGQTWILQDYLQGAEVVLSSHRCESCFTEYSRQLQRGNHVLQGYYRNSPV